MLVTANEPNQCRRRSATLPDGICAGLAHAPTGMWPDICPECPDAAVYDLPHRLPGDAPSGGTSPGAGTLFLSSTCVGLAPLGLDRTPPPRGHRGALPSVAERAARWHRDLRSRVRRLRIRCPSPRRRFPTQDQMSETAWVAARSLRIRWRSAAGVWIGNAGCVPGGCRSGGSRRRGSERLGPCRIRRRP